MAGCSFYGSQCVSDKTLFSPLTNSSFLAPEATTDIRVQGPGTPLQAPTFTVLPRCPRSRFAPFSLKVGGKSARRESRRGGKDRKENLGESERKKAQKASWMQLEQAAGTLHGPQRSRTNRHPPAILLPAPLPAPPAGARLRQLQGVQVLGANLLPLDYGPLAERS